MSPRELQRQVLAQHRVIDARLERLEAVAQPIADGERQLRGPLNEQCEQLIREVQEHVAWENRYVPPALRGARKGEEWAQRLERDHREQAALLREIAELCTRDRAPAMAAARLLEFAEALRAEMRREESLLADAGAHGASLRLE